MIDLSSMSIEEFTEYKNVKNFISWCNKNDYNIERLSYQTGFDDFFSDYIHYKKQNK